MEYQNAISGGISDEKLVFSCNEIFSREKARYIEIPLQSNCLANIRCLALKITELKCTIFFDKVPSSHIEFLPFCVKMAVAQPIIKLKHSKSCCK